MLAVSSSSAVTSTAGTSHVAKSLRVRPDQIEVDKAQFSTWPRSPDKNGNNRAAKSVAIDHSGPDQTTARWSRSAGRIRPTARSLRALLRMTPPADIVRPVGTRTVFVRTRGDIGCELVWRRQRSPDEAKDEGNARPRRGPTRMRPRPDELVRIRRFMGSTRHTPNKTGAEDVGNSTSSAPALSKLWSRDPGFRKPYSSAGSSPSASRSGVPARICSAIRPEFWRIAVSIFAVMSGLAFRNAFEFSRPWPSRWLS